MNASLSYSWTQNGQPFSSEPSVEITEAGIYQLSVSESSCGREDGAVFNIAELLTLDGELLSPCDALYSDDSPLTVTPGGTGLSQPLIWVWQIADSVYSNSSEAQFGSMADNGLYAVSATQDSSQTGCNRSAAAEIEIFLHPCDIVIPNVFTPNGDNKNDTFLGQYDALNSGIDVHLTVFNRWGNVVYENEKYKGDWKANDVPDGTYYYTLKVSGALQARDTYGYVTIFRKD
jgi:gliding motility-associated-like protein